MLICDGFIAGIMNDVMFLLIVILYVPSSSWLWKNKKQYFWFCFPPPLYYFQLSLFCNVYIQLFQIFIAISPQFLC